MKINSIKTNNVSEIDVKRNKKDINFSTQFSLAKKNSTIEELESSMKKIKDIGTRICLTKSYVDVSMYKKEIKEYFKNIVDSMYENNKSFSFWEEKYFNTVKVVNEKLEELSKRLISDEKENISVVSDIDIIQGLLIDLYV